MASDDWETARERYRKWMEEVLYGGEQRVHWPYDRVAVADPEEEDESEVSEDFRLMLHSLGIEWGA